jgi:sulfate permease, SulP family
MCRTESQAVRLLLAKSVGQVRDVISTAEPAVAVAARYGSVEQAVAAAQRLMDERSDPHGQ